jgi:hypothetical protein
VISASHVQKAAAFAMWPKPQNRQNNMIFGEYGLPYHTIFKEGERKGELNKGKSLISKSKA